MKSEEEILDNIEREEKYVADTKNPMDLDEWANHNGWIDALKWVLGIEDIYRKVSKGVNDESNK